MAGKEAYNLDNVSSVDTSTKMSEMPFPARKGDTSLDGVISVDTSSKLTYTPDDAFPSGASVPLDAVTGLPMGEGAQKRYEGNTGDIETWPKAFE